MSKPYDATLNALLDDHVADWAGFLAGRCGVPMGRVTPLDTDLSATLQPDRLLRVDGPAPAVLHLELESTGRLGVPRELLRYNAFAHHLTELPVHSVLVLLRPKANATDQTGEYIVPDGRGGELVRFRYAVVRVWQETVADLLAAGPGVAPLALLTNEADVDLPAAFVRLRDRLRADAASDTVERSLLGSTFVLCGLRYAQTRIKELYENMSLSLEDSTTYQLLVNRGEVRGVQASILELGDMRFGPPPETVQAAVRGITDRERLTRILRHAMDATDWDDLVRTP